MTAKVQQSAPREYDFDGISERTPVARNGEVVMSPYKRTVSADPGLMTKEQLLANYTGGRRKSLEQLIGGESPETFTFKSRLEGLLSSIRDDVQYILDYGKISLTCYDFMAIVIVFVLFGDDAQLLFFTPRADLTFSILFSIAFFLFICEMVLRSWAKSDFSKGFKKITGYCFSFYFWLDLLAIITMIPSVPWLSVSLGINRFMALGHNGARIRRVSHMIRLVRLVHQHALSSSKGRDQRMLDELESLADQGRLDQGEITEYLDRMNNQQKQTKVGAQLSDIITRKVIVAVLLIVCIVPLLSYSSVNQDEVDATMFLQAININAGNTIQTDCDYLIGSANTYKHFLRDGQRKLLVGLTISPSRCNSSETIDFESVELIQRLRPDAIRVVSITPTVIDGSTYSLTATFNLQSEINAACRSSIYLTLFVILVLKTLSALFTNDAQKLVLTPLEEMMDMVNTVANDPLKDYNFDPAVGGGQYETRVVRLAIQKITSLLRVGFGVAGAEIISTNMDVEGEENAVLRPMIPGKRIYAIFGFCDIHAFDLCTERLEDEIMAFVNSIARIVHEEVTRWGGLCNRNLGNSFLMVWRIGDEENLQTVCGKARRKNSEKETSSASLVKKSRSMIAELDLRRMPGLDVKSDKALIGFLRVIIEVNRDRQVLAYRKDERLSIGPNEGFTLRMGFGLNAGWAIEGAVGSLQKVDATYLSPHVNMAARMEAASRQFGVSILMTERFHELLSTEAQEQCRKIDVVTVKGSVVPMPIYTYETFQNQTFPVLQTPKYSGLALNTVLSQQALDYTPLAWMQDPDLVQLRRLATPEFKSTFQEGLQCYISGQWDQARDLLERADTMMAGNDLGYDGPSRVLLNYMRVRNWVPPDGWKGYRPLTSK